MKIALITVDGVLSQGADLRSAPPQKWSKPLYEAVRSQFRTVAFAPCDDNLLRWWLNKEGLGNWSATLGAAASPMPYDEWCVDQVREFLANGWELAFVLTNNAAVAEGARRLGVLTMSLGIPDHLPGWKSEDSQFVPWEQLEARA